jgi:hypothetical protein
MTTTTTLGFGSLLLLLTAAFTAPIGTATTRGEPSSFLGEVHGAMTATPRGDATFGTVPAVDGRPGSFSLALGARGEDGAVLFSRSSGTRLSIGTYAISARGGGGDDVRALVLTGSPTRPTGVFQADRGELVITSVSDSTIRGFFRLEATGFLASEPGREDRTVSAAGTFAATGR